jgi:hypothetical protein
LTFIRFSFSDALWRIRVLQVRQPRWQAQGEACALFFAPDLNVAMVHLDDAIDGRQPEACPLAERLGGEKRREQLRTYLLRHPRARVSSRGLDMLQAGVAGRIGMMPTFYPYWVHLSSAPRAGCD